MFHRRVKEPAPIDDDRNLRALPVFVIGPFHSGTTLLYRMLALHPDTTWLSQFSVRDGSVPGRRRLPFYAGIDVVSRRMFKFDWEKRGNTWRDFLVARPSEAQPLWDCIISRSESLDDAVSVRRLRRMLETESGRWGNRPFLVKYPALSEHIPILRAAYPQAKFVHIVRDGRAVSLSLKAWLLEERTRDFVVRDGKGVPRDSLPSNYPQVRSDEEALTRAVHYWMRCIRLIRAERERIELYELRYEDFCADVSSHLERLLSDLSLDPGRFPFSRCPAKLKSTNDRWIQAASVAELQYLNATLEDELRLYSYI